MFFYLHSVKLTLLSLTVIYLFLQIFNITPKSYLMWCVQNLHTPVQLWCRCMYGVYIRVKADSRELWHRKASVRGHAWHLLPLIFNWQLTYLPLENCSTLYVLVCSQRRLPVKQIYQIKCRASALLNFFVVSSNYFILSNTKFFEKIWIVCNLL